MAAISSENVGPDRAPSNKDLTGGDANSVGKSGGIGGEDSSKYNPINIGGNSGLPKSVQSPL